MSRNPAKRESLPRGRPRDKDKGAVILDSARRLVTDLGYEEVTTQMIADAAGVGKQTIYRRWPGKADLVLDAFLAYSKSEVDNSVINQGTPQEQVTRFLMRTFDALKEAGPGVRSLMAVAQRDESFCANFRTRFIEMRRQSLVNLLKDAVSQHLTSPVIEDLEVATIALYGAVWYRLLLNESLDKDYATRLAAIVVRGLSPQR